MVDSPMYDRLMRLVAAIESASALDASDDEHNTIVCGLNEANNVTHHMRSYQGFTGETGDQIDAWTDATMKQVQGIKENHNTAMEYYVEARRAMTHIREEAQQLSPTLIDSNLQKLADATHVAVPVVKYLGRSANRSTRSRCRPTPTSRRLSLRPMHSGRSRRRTFLSERIIRCRSWLTVFLLRRSSSMILAHTSGPGKGRRFLRFVTTSRMDT